MTRDLVSLDDLPDATLQGLLTLGEAIRKDRNPYSEALRGSLMASLFLEPSTRTRLSFEAAMHRLGGRVITVADPKTSSAAKGETLRDTVRVADQYADLLVLRHPLMGAARVAADAAIAPVLNAGDGGHEHPTQTLCDLLTLRAERGVVSGRLVVLYGDLRYGRTAHSLSRTLVRLGARVLFVAEDGFEPPSAVIRRLTHTPGVALRQLTLDGAALGGPDRAVLMAGPVADLPEEGARLGWADDEPLALYATRAQEERFTEEEAQRAPSLPRVDRALLGRPGLESTVVLHPLPRRSEVDAEIDDDPRAAYFRQVGHGVPARMALLLWAAGRVDLPEATPESGVPLSGRVCENRGCVSGEPGERVAARFLERSGAPPVCAFCHAPCR